MSSSWHENRYRISVNNVNLNEPQEIPLESFQDQSEWTTHFYQHQEDAQLGSGNGCVIAAVLNRQVPAGSVVPSMQLMESSTVSFSDSGMEPRSTSQAREDGQEMTMDRKQKRIMKNRESAARSRARKLVTNQSFLFFLISFFGFFI